MNSRIFYNRYIYLTSLLILYILTNQNILAQRYWNVAAKFDGNSYIAVAPSYDLRNLSGSFSAECWFNSSTASTSTLFGNPRFRFLLDSTGNGLAARIQTNATTRIRIEPSDGAIKLNRWYHLACTFDSTTAEMNCYINGVLEGSVTGDSKIGIIPGTDSIYIGTSVYGSFNGMMDDIRIWNRALSAQEILNNMRIPYSDLLNSETENIGTGLVLSASFDWVFPGNEGLNFYDGYNGYVNHGAQAFTLGDHPSRTNGINASLDLTKGGYVKVPSNPNIELTKPMTAEAWIYPLSATGRDIKYILRKGSDYQFYLNNDGNIYYAFGEAGFADKLSKQVISSNKWTHVAITCSPTGLGKLYINGKQDTSNNFQVGASPGKDTLFIGSFSDLALTFLGYIDGVKISNYEKTENEINSDMFKVVDITNQPEPPKSTVSLNFEYDNISLTNSAALDSYENRAKNSVIGTGNYVPVSPIIGGNVQAFNEYNIKYSGKRIPQFNTAGYMEADSLNFTSSQTISTVQLFLALNHENLSDLNIYLQSPSGDSVLVWNDNFGVNPGIGQIITVFDDNAQDTLTNGLYVDFGPYIKPFSTMNSIFFGKNSKGIWKLKIIDLFNGNTGYLYGWGLRINSTTGVNNLAASVPKEYILEQNYPNPFNPSTVIKFSIPKASFVNLTVYDILGREVRTLVNNQMQEGYHELELKGNDLASGMYIYKLNVDNRNFIKKMLLLK